MSLLVSKKRLCIGWTPASNGASTKSTERLSQRKGALPLPFAPAVRPPVAFLVALLLPVCQNFPFSHECAAPLFHLLPKRFQTLGGETVLRLGKQLFFFFFDMVRDILAQHLHFGVIPLVLWRQLVQLGQQSLRYLVFLDCLLDLHPVLDEIQEELPLSMHRERLRNVGDQVRLFLCRPVAQALEFLEEILNDFVISFRS